MVHYQRGTDADHAYRAHLFTNATNVNHADGGCDNYRKVPKTKLPKTNPNSNPNPTGLYDLEFGV